MCINGGGGSLPIRGMCRSYTCPVGNLYKGARAWRGERNLVFRIRVRGDQALGRRAFLGPRSAFYATFLFGDGRSGKCLPTISARRRYEYTGLQTTGGRNPTHRFNASTTRSKC